MSTYKELHEVLREELMHLWSDFSEQKRSAMVRNLNPLNEGNGWSIGMLGVADRIADITKVVGSIEWQKVNVDLLLDGWWEAIHKRADLEVPPFDIDRANEVRERNNRPRTSM